MINEELLDKLNKIRTLRDAAGTEGEAQAAAAMLQKLLTKYNLDVADLERRGAQKASAIKEDPYDLGKAAFKWKLELASGVAKHFYCYPLIDMRTKKVSFIGRPDNVESMRMLYGWFIEQIKRFARETRPSDIDPLRWQVNFGLGAVDRLIVRLADQAQEDAANVEVTALVIHHQSEIGDYLEQSYGWRQDGKRTKEQTERDQRYRTERAEMEELKVRDIEAYYKKYPWDRPLTEEQIARTHEAQAKYNAQWERRQKTSEARAKRTEERRRNNPEYQEKLSQEVLARAVGRDTANNINLRPFLGGGKLDSAE